MLKKMEGGGHPDPPLPGIGLSRYICNICNCGKTDEKK